MPISHSRRDEENEKTSENILRITDELVSELNKARRLLIVSIIVIVISIPLAWHAAPLFSNSPTRFTFIGFVTLAVALIFLVLGIRQWQAISRWTKRYREYKERISEIDKQLDFETGKES